MQDNGKKLGIGSIVTWRTVNKIEQGTIIGKHGPRHAVVRMENGMCIVLSKKSIRQIL